MSVQTSSDAGPHPPLRLVRDSDRPAVSTREASERLAKSRYHVAELVRTGQLPGYGIRGPSRTRWFVYEDALPRVAPSRPPAGTAIDAIVDDLLKARELGRSERRARLDAEKEALHSLSALDAALDAALRGDDREAAQLRAESGRYDTACRIRITEAQQSSTDAEAAIDDVIHRLRALVE